MRRTHPDTMTTTLYAASGRLIELTHWLDLHGVLDVC
jgi:hypothetical protein